MRTKLQCGALVDVQLSHGTSVARVHDADPLSKYVTLRCYNARERRWSKRVLVTWRSNIVRVLPPSRFPQLDPQVPQESSR